MMNRDEIKVGQKVYFGRANGEKTLGTVLKVNRAKCKIRQEEQRGIYRDYRVGTVWGVPFNLMWTEDDRPDYVTKRRPCLVNIVTGERHYGHPGEDPEMIFERLANGMEN